MDGLFGEIVATELMNVGQSFGATWNRMPGEPGDWMGLYSVGAPDANPWLWIMAEDDSYTWLLPGVFPAGTYEFRMFDGYSFERIGTSNPVRLQDPNNPFVLVNDAPIDARQIVQNYSDVTWAEGAPNIDAYYFDGVSFAAGEVNYVTTPAQGPLPYGGALHMTLELTGGPVVWSDHDGSMTSAGAFAYMQKVGDDWTGQGEHNASRLWADEPIMFSGQESGRFSISVPLTEQFWSGVLTDVTQAQFQAVLSNPAVLGFTLLNGTGKGHGEIDFAGGDAFLKVIDYVVVV